MFLVQFYAASHILGEKRLGDSVNVFVQVHGNS